MKNIKLKILLSFFIISFSLCGWCEQTNAKLNDSETYQEYLFIDNSWETVVRYYYKKSVVEILVPRTRMDFIKLEHQFIGWQLSPTHKYYKTILINITLIKFWLKPLYY